VPELPVRVFHGQLPRNAGSLQPDTRTVLAEVDVDNADGVLAAGLYAIVHLKAPRNYSVFALASGDLRQEWAGARWVIRLQHLDLAADQGGGVGSGANGRIWPAMMSAELPEGWAWAS
jgi:hypothetical protein